MASREPENSSLDGIMQFVSSSWDAEEVKRWSGSPYTQEALASGRSESIGTHMWGACLLWHEIAAAKTAWRDALDPYLVDGIIITHDVHEIYAQDTSRYQLEINGVADPKERETTALKKITELLSPMRQAQYLDEYLRFESKEIDAHTSAELLTAIIMDNLHGNLFVISFGTDLFEYTDAINKIIAKKLGKAYKRLLNLFYDQGRDEAANAVHEVIVHHLGLFEKAGVLINWKNF